MPTYTHLGFRPQVGHVHTGRLYGHRDYRGKVHAITGTDYRSFHGVGLRYYVTLCGDLIPVNDDSAETVRPAADQAGAGVTCRRCRKLVA